MKGQTGGSLGGRTERAPRCKHMWSTWQRVAVFDKRSRRTCQKCGWLQFRAAKKSEGPARVRSKLTPTETALVAAFAPDSPVVAELKAKLRASIKESKQRRSRSAG